MYIKSENTTLLASWSVFTVLGSDLFKGNSYHGENQLFLLKKQTEGQIWQ